METGSTTYTRLLLSFQDVNWAHKIDSLTELCNQNFAKSPETPKAGHPAVLPLQMMPWNALEAGIRIHGSRPNRRDYRSCHIFRSKGEGLFWIWKRVRSDMHPDN